MTNLAKQIQDPKLTATAGHLDQLIERMKIINHKSWPMKFGKVAESILELKPRYHVENILLNEEDGLIDVDYCTVEDWKDFEKGQLSVDDIAWREERISCAKLQAFAIEEKMNHYCRDWADHRGEHQQETGVTPIEYLMDDYDFLQDAVKAYLEAGREVEI